MISLSTGDRWLFDQLSEPAFLLDPQRQILAVNPAAATLFNVSEAHVRGRRCSTVTGFARCESSCAFDEVVRSGQGKKSLDLECLQSCDGSSLCVELTPLRDAEGQVVAVLELMHDASIVRTLTDRLEQKQARLRTEIERSRTLVNSIADGVYSIDLDMCLTSFSRGAELMTGYNEEEVLGRKCFEVFRTSVCDTDCPLKWTLKNEQPVQNCSAAIIDKQNRRIPAFLSSDLLRDSNGDICGCVGIIRDRSEVENLKAKMHNEYTFSDFVGKSKVMGEIFDRVRTVAATETTVLIAGESGTGKELLARAIHYRSARKAGAFVKVNCASLAETLLESELFGHEKGAFTGAVKSKPGRFELANGGTLFLDEIGDTSLALQAKLLRVLQEREFERVGGIQTLKTDVRVIAATNRDLQKLIASGDFREDLYYRLCVVPVHLPPLRERREDIPLLVEYFVQKFNARGERIREVSSRAMAQLINYDWPGNVRELENAIEHAYVTSVTDRVERRFLPAAIQQAAVASEPDPEGDQFCASEREQLMQALDRHRWKKAPAAQELGLSRTTLWRKMKQYDLV
jgi:PAS domain S-box-containing protein